MRISKEELKKSVNHIVKDVPQELPVKFYMLDHMGVEHETNSENLGRWGYRSFNGKVNEYYIYVNQNNEPFQDNKLYAVESKRIADMKGVGKTPFKFLKTGRDEYNLNMGRLQNKDPQILERLKGRL